MVPLKYLTNFWKTLEMSVINCEISLMLTWSKNCFLISDTLENQNEKFTITVTLSSQDNVKLLRKLESGFKRTINWNKYQSKVTHQT